MHFVTPKKSLQTALDRLSQIIKSNPRSVEILQCVRVDTYSTEVYITATSSMASARVQVVGAVVGEPGQFVVGWDRLKDRVSKAAGTIQIQTEGSGLKIVSSEDQKLGLSLNDPEEFPKIEWVEVEESYGLVKKDVISLFKTASALTSNVSSLTPAFLQVNLEDQKLWVANGMSYQMFPVKSNPSLKSAIPTQTLSALAAFMQEAEGETVWLSQMNGDEIVASVGNDQFQTVPLAVAFPNLQPIFDKVKVSTPYECTVNRARLIAELLNAKSSSDKYGRVSVKIEGLGSALVLIETKSETGDWYESKMPCIWTGAASRELTFNLESLLKFIQTFDSDEITLYIGDDFKGDLTAVYCSEGGHSGVINQFRI